MEFAIVVKLSFISVINSLYFKQRYIYLEMSNSPKCCPISSCSTQKTLVHKIINNYMQTNFNQKWCYICLLKTPQDNDAIIACLEHSRTHNVIIVCLRLSKTHDVIIACLDASEHCPSLIGFPNVLEHNGFYMPAYPLVCLLNFFQVIIIYKNGCLLVSLPACCSKLATILL